MTETANSLKTEVVVLGAGPGGYAAAFRCADLGRRTVLVERYPTLGGVCLNVGCIPSKALLHVAGLVTEIEEYKTHGIDLGQPNIDPSRLRTWAEAVVGRLTSGLNTLASQRQVQVIHGLGVFTGAHRLQVSTATETLCIDFDHAVIAAGSQARPLPDLPEDPRIMDSTSALRLRSIPERLLVIGAGVIGLELATVYRALGSRITLVETLDRVLAGCDEDMVRPLWRRLQERCEAIHLETTVQAIEPTENALRVHLKGPRGNTALEVNAVLVAVGRVPNGHAIAARAAGVYVSEPGFIPVDEQMRSNCPHIFAVGDIARPPLLAHKAAHEGKVAAEVIAGHKSGFDGRRVPAVAYTDPELAWVGLTEIEAARQGIGYRKAIFPWAANARSLTLARSEGLTKLLFDPESGRVLGMAAVGPNAGELIAEGTLAIEMGCDARDLALTIHPHPTLSETIGLAAEVHEGTVTDLYLPGRDRVTKPR